MTREARTHDGAQYEGVLDWLIWLADAPLFIDDALVTSFYDAVVRPEGKRNKITINLKNVKGTTTSVAGGITAKAGVADWIRSIFPFLTADVELSGEGSHERTRESEKGETVEILTIDTPQRQLVQLALHYISNIPERLRYVPDPYATNWRNPDFISELPRALVFVDFPPKTKMLPMAAEVHNGTVVEIHKPLAEHYQSKNPDDTLPDRRENVTAYWQWWQRQFDWGWDAMEMVERVIAEGGGRVRWIDFRVPLDDTTAPLHLHICGRQQYDTGVFAYNTIRRSFKHGIRAVGTLKSEPDMNVLALFDR